MALHFSVNVPSTSAVHVVVIASAYHLCSVHVLCVCVLFVTTCCVYPACLCGRVCCVTRSTLSTLEVDMALLSVSHLTCGTWSQEWNIVLTLSLLTQHIVYQLCWWFVHVSDQSCFFMQDGVGERDVIFTEVEQSLSGMGQLEKLVLGIGHDVSLRWYNIVVINHTSALVQGM